MVKERHIKQGATLYYLYMRASDRACKMRESPQPNSYLSFLVHAEWELPEIVSEQISGQYRE